MRDISLGQLIILEKINPFLEHTFLDFDHI